MNASKCIRYFARFFFVLPLALTLSACDLGDPGDDLPGGSSETGASMNTEGAPSNTDEPIGDSTDEPGSSVLDGAPTVIVAEGDGSVNAEGLCPYRYRCGGVNGTWYSTSAGCTAVCATTCSKQEFNNGHCIPR